ncbi:hypothetical protein ACWEVP_44995 [Amycolatopsis sp. NPDC003865]
MKPDARLTRWRSPLRRMRTRPRTNPTCKVTLDLRGVPWGADPDKAASLLKQQPGVVDVRVDPRRRRAVVLHDATTSLPALWNWLVTQSTTGPETTKD